MLAEKFLNARLVAMFFVVEDVALLVKERLEDAHEVEEARWSHICLPTSLGHECFAQLRGFHVVDFGRFDNLFLQFILERCLLHHPHGNGVECLNRPLVEPVKSAAIDERGEVADSFAKGVPSRTHR